MIDRIDEFTLFPLRVTDVRQYDWLMRARLVYCNIWFPCPHFELPMSSISATGVSAWFTSWCCSAYHYKFYVLHVYLTYFDSLYMKCSFVVRVVYWRQSFRSFGEWSLPFRVWGGDNMGINGSFPDTPQTVHCIVNHWYSKYESNEVPALSGLTKTGGYECWPDRASIYNTFRISQVVHNLLLKCGQSYCVWRAFSSENLLFRESRRRLTQLIRSPIRHFIHLMFDSSIGQQSTV
jgi:hypothetical protein